MVEFAIIGTQRSGTTYIRYLLDSHPQIRCIGEAFLLRILKKSYPGILGYPHYVNESIGRHLKHYLMRTALVSEYLDYLYAAEGFTSVGFKFMYTQAKKFPPKFPMVTKYLIKNNVKIIHVIRKNLVKVLVSRETAKKTGIYRSNAKMKHIKIHLPTENLLKKLSELENENNKWEKLFTHSPYYKAYYEAFVTDKDNESRKLLSFLDITEFGQLSTPIVKINPDKLKDILDNYTELKNLLSNTKYEWCLYS
jgi:hypothetical protein